jgi:hypothetical protein
VKDTENLSSTDVASGGEAVGDELRRSRGGQGRADNLI